MSAFESRHLRQWCERFAPSRECPEDVAERLEAFLDALTPEEREWWLDRGWTAVFDHVASAEAVLTP